MQKLDLKRFVDLQDCYILLLLRKRTPEQPVLLEIFAYPSSKRVIYGHCIFYYGLLPQGIGVL